jgi:protein-S-isoprenylcysteine O-methyltransferase Ste14
MTNDMTLRIVAIVSTLAFLGLAVVGEGGFMAFVAHPALVVLALVTLALAVAAMFSSGNLSSGEREDRGNRWVIAVFGVLGLAMGVLPALTDRLEILTLDGEALRWFGVGLYALGGALRLWPVFVLGRRFSGLVAIQPGHELVTTGVYSMIRHPSYLGLLVNLAGWALAFRSLVGVALVAATVPPLLARIAAEEALLRDHFGAHYDAYRARTARLVPGLW